MFTFDGGYLASILEVGVPIAILRTECCRLRHHFSICCNSAQTRFRKHGLATNRPNSPTAFCIGASESGVGFFSKVGGQGQHVFLSPMAGLTLHAAWADTWRLRRGALLPAKVRLVERARSGILLT